jgi:hypothetical protein
LHSQQIAIGRRLVRQPQTLEEMCQVSIFHLGRLFERSPSLGLELDEGILGGLGKRDPRGSHVQRRHESWHIAVPSFPL